MGGEFGCGTEGENEARWKFNGRRKSPRAVAPEHLCNEAHVLTLWSFESQHLPAPSTSKRVDESSHRVSFDCAGRSSKDLQAMSAVAERPERKHWTTRRGGFAGS